MAKKNIKTEEIITEDDLINAYIGEKKEKLRNDDISVETLIFGPFYFLYYKLYFLAVPIILLELILAYFLIIHGAYFYVLLLPVVVRLFFATLFKRIYLFSVKKKVADLKKYNSHKTDEEILELCKKQSKGKTLMNENDAKKLVGVVTTYAVIIAILGLVIFIIISNLLDNLN